MATARPGQQMVHAPSGRSFRVKRVVAPGLWIDTDDALHFSVPDLMAEFGIPDTEENRDMVVDVCRELAREQMPDAPITEQL